jgi:hypothetical protein
MFLYQLSNSYLKNHNVLVHPDEVSALQMKFDREKAERQTFMNIIYLLSAVHHSRRDISGDSGLSSNDGEVIPQYH